MLPNLDSQVRARIVALDTRAQSALSPTSIAGLLGLSANPSLPGDAMGPMLADKRSHDIWGQLAEEYYAVAVDSGEALVTIHDLAPRFGSLWSSDQVRRLCHQRLAALPRVYRASHRQRVDAEAKALLAQGRTNLDPAPLRQLVDELFCSSYADQALDMLGDLAFERGEFDEAIHWWRLLTPLELVRRDSLRYPDPKLDLARIEAKQILALAFSSRDQDADRELVKFQERHPEAKGRFLGRDALYAKTLADAITKFRRSPLPRPDDAWTTFGGNIGRNRTIKLHLGTPWEEPIKLPSLSAKGNGPGSNSRKQRAQFHPVIANQQVLIANHISLFSYDLTTGKELFRYDPTPAKNGRWSEEALDQTRFTLTAEGDRAYVRFGPPGIGPKLKEGSSCLVCIDLAFPGRDRKRELWRVTPPAVENAFVSFEGSPLVHGGRIYIAMSKVVGMRTTTSIVCLDRLGRQRWSTEVCDAPEFEGNSDPRFRDHTLTWAAGQIVYCNHAGAVVAVDAWTGQPTWAARYPSRGSRTSDGDPSPRDLAPCVHVDGRIYVAPSDTDRVFCLDALTGRLCWESDPVEVVHLLGAAQGRLIATTVDGLCAWDTHTGESAWRQPAQGRLPSLGRGLIAPPLVLWPTTDPLLPIRAVNIDDGMPALDPTRFSHVSVGNMAFAQGCLVIAGPRELIAFTPGNGDGFSLEPRPHVRLDSVLQFLTRSPISDDLRRRIR